MMHALSANILGDKSEQLKMRITLNPIKHIDMWGSVLLPIMLLLSNSGFLFGWAKPVKIDINAFSHPNRDMAITAIAGPVSNLILALIGILIIRSGIGFFNSNEIIYTVMYMFILLNIILFIFNMLPIPPLDGSRLFAYILPVEMKKQYFKYGPYAMIIIFIFMLVGIFNSFFIWLNTLLGSII